MIRISQTHKKSRCKSGGENYGATMTTPQASAGEALKDMKGKAKALSPLAVVSAYV
jgi:hypothetical protein